MGFNMLTEHAQSMLGGVKSENPMGKGKLGNEIRLKLNYTAFKPTSKVTAPSRTSWSPLRTKSLWSTKVVPYICINVVT